MIDICGGEHRPATLKPIVEPVREQRRRLAREAARIYAETKSLRKVGEWLNVSHDSARQLVKGAGEAPP